MNLICRYIFLPIIFSANTSFLQAQSSDKRPNIIYIMADDLGYADLSCYGRKNYQTRHLDKLASEGMKFTSAYSAGSLCTPTRTAFMTGRYPARTPVGLMEPLRMNKRDSTIGLSADYPSLAFLLKKSGYETILVGKWHLGFLPEYHPLRNGFDEFFGFLSGGIDYISHKGETRQADLYENTTPVKKEGYLTDLLMEKAIDVIKRSHNKPFFLSLQFNAPHWPWQGPTDKAYPDTGRFTAGGSPEIYAAMMKSLDNAVGNIMQALDKNDLAGNTVVIFTSDNGGEKFSDMGSYAKGKFTLWEGGIRVPAFVRWLGKIAVNSSSDQAIITMDWTATILSIANAKPDENFPLDGENILPVLTRQEKTSERTFYWRTSQRRLQNAIREGQWKYLKDDKDEYLFDLATDPGEKNNLKEKHVDIFEKLKQKYGEWEKTVLKPIPLN